MISVFDHYRLHQHECCWYISNPDTKKNLTYICVLQPLLDKRQFSLVHLHNICRIHFLYWRLDYYVDRILPIQLSGESSIFLNLTTSSSVRSREVEKYKSREVEKRAEFQRGMHESLKSNQFNTCTISRTCNRLIIISMVSLSPD